MNGRVRNSSRSNFTVGIIKSRYGGRAQSGEVAYSPEQSKQIAEDLWNQCIHLLAKYTNT
jgi:hypothetical protein